MKEASPAVYTFPYDDMSSTFVCNNNSGGAYNTVNYDITFCPGGKTGRQTTAAQLHGRGGASWIDNFLQ